MNVDASKIQRTLGKLKRKNIVLFKDAMRKICQIALCDEISVQHFKNLRHDSSEFKRVHVGNFVLTFIVKGNTVIFEKFAHHDEAYK